MQEAPNEVFSCQLVKETQTGLTKRRGIKDLPSHILLLFW